MRKFSAEYVWMPDGIRARQTITVNDQNRIESIADATDQDNVLPGIISTGFVNAHCHLELSHLQGQIEPGTGMSGFVRKLQSIRNNFTDAERLAAAQKAADAMYNSGTSAVGDISNGNLTLPIKKDHPVLFHTFVELFGADQSRAQDIYDAGEALVGEFPAGEASLTIHAPYSVSGLLRDLVYERGRVLETPLSVHLMESVEEMQLFSDLEGPLFDFLRDVGAPFNGHQYEHPAEFVVNSEFHEGLPLNVDQAFLFVHNTEMDAKTLEFLAENYFANFVLCPRANQYIHGKLPDSQLFQAYGDFVCIGTDSLAGNESLDMVQEMYTLQKANSTLKTEELLDWACLNGAVAIGLEEKLPCEISVDMPADLVLIENINLSDVSLTAASQATRLAGRKENP